MSKMKRSEAFEELKALEKSKAFKRLLKSFEASVKAVKLL